MTSLTSLFASVERGNPAVIRGAFDRESRPDEWTGSESGRREPAVAIEMTHGGYWAIMDPIAALRA